MGTTFFNRKWSIKIQDSDAVSDTGGLEEALDFSAFDVEFSVRKTIDTTPNACKVVIYNMNESHRKLFQSLSQNFVELYAGYEDGNYGMLYRGDLRSAYSVKMEEDWVTTIQSADGAAAMAMASVNAPATPGMTGLDVLKKIATTVGLDAKDVERLSGKFGGRLNKPLFGSRGGVITGNAAQNMTQVCSGAGLDWSIQDGQLLVTPKGQAIDGFAYELTPAHGLIGSPAIEAHGKPGKKATVVTKKELGTHVVTATSLLNPALVPGGKVSIESEHVTGVYRITEVEHKGSSFGKDWYSSIKALPV